MPLDLNRPVQTRDGRKARIICTDRGGVSYPVVALVTISSEGGTEAVQAYTTDGLQVEGREGHPTDLVNVPERICGWVNLYPPGVASSRSAHVNGVYATREEADGEAGTDRIGVAYIDTERLP